MRAARVGFYVKATAFTPYCSSQTDPGASTIFAVVKFDGDEGHGCRKCGDEHHEGDRDAHRC